MAAWRSAHRPELRRGRAVAARALDVHAARYRPEPVGFRIVPVYAPGLPMLMAIAKALIGQCGLFLIVPISGGVLVFATFLIGTRIGRPLVGVAASALVATSPAVLYMLMAPMSDVPAAAAWAVAVASVLVDTTAGAGVAGLASALAILIRPNLAPLAALLAAWMVWRRGARPRALVFTLVASIGAVGVAVVNTRLYGSPLASGYRRPLHGVLALARFHEPESLPDMARVSGDRVCGGWTRVLGGSIDAPMENAAIQRRENPARAVRRGRLGLSPFFTSSTRRVVVLAVPVAQLADDGDWDCVVPGERVAPPPARRPTGRRARAGEHLRNTSYPGESSRHLRRSARGSQVRRGRPRRRITDVARRRCDHRSAQRQPALLRGTADVAVGLR